MLLADRLSSTVAPASAARAMGGSGTQTSSQISTMEGEGTEGRRRRTAGRRRTAPRAAGDRERAGRSPSPGREMPLLVELAIVRQVLFGTTPSSRPRWITTAQL